MIPLSGGEKDITAPKVINQSPANAELNFTGNKLIIDFDEYVQLKDIQGQLIVTPQINYLPEANVKGKRLELNFKEPLRKETTYSINFGSSISDIHEGNVLQDYNIVFATGSFIDTLSIQGRISDAFTKKSRNDVSVFLYENGNDSSCFVRKPDYFAKSDNT
ncbi:MAG: Ig-like domain-containing protein, partial [Bacteroidota bacterium]